MMYLLALDVLKGLVQLRHADAEGAVFHLPSKKPVLREGVMNPLGRAALDELQRFGNRESRGQGQQNMNVVGHAPNFNGLHLILPGDAAQKGPEPLAQLRRDWGAAFFGAEDAME